MATVGLSREVWQFLCAARASGADFTRTLQIGRQDVATSARDIRRSARQAGIESITVPTDRYAEALLRQLGAVTVDSLDRSAFEGATVLHDLNTPLDPSMRRMYTAVVDGGTLEHIFDVRTAIANLMDLVAVGGHLLMANPADRCIGHGFYQFSPDFYYRVLCPENGFQIEQLLLSDKGLRQHWYEVSDSADGSLPTFQARGIAYAFVRARRVDDRPPFAIMPQQSRYIAAWSASPRTRLRTAVWESILHSPPWARQAAYSVRATVQRRSGRYRAAYRPVRLLGRTTASCRSPV